MIHGHSYIRRITGRMVATDPEALLAINPEALAQQAKIERFRRKKKIEKIFFCNIYCGHLQHIRHNNSVCAVMTKKMKK